MDLEHGYVLVIGNLMGTNLFLKCNQLFESVSKLQCLILECNEILCNLIQQKI